MMRRRVAQARVGRLATLGNASQPHLVPVCFALAGEQLITAVDKKPKSTTWLKRLDNVRLHPAVSVLIDHFEEDWVRLWWVRLDGRARVLEDGPELEQLLTPLHDKYRGHYGLHPPLGPAIVVDITRWVGWSASGTG